MATTLKDIGTIGGIQRVVWIDDLFANNVDQIAEQIAIKVPALLNAGQALVHADLQAAKWDTTASPGAIRAQVLGIIGTDKGKGLTILESLIKQQNEGSDTPEPLVADLSSAQVALIKDAFPNVETLSYSAWQQGKANILATSDESVLFMVDCDFSYEIPNARTLGHTILKELLARPQPKCSHILLSHAFLQENEIAERDDFSSKHDCNAGFAFISKERLTRNAGDVLEQNQLMASALQDALVRAWCHRLSETAAEVVGRSLKGVHRHLLNQTFEDIGGGIFHLSRKDGVTEIDTLARIFMLGSRVAIQDELQKNSELQGRLQKLRKIIKATGYSPEPGKSLSGTLKAWRSREVWDPGEVVNRSLAAPSCGDVFVSSHTTPRVFILLGQPCNLAVRADGSRNDNEALFSECFKKGGHPASTYRLEIDGVEQFARFDYVFPINLSVLDAVAAQPTGEVALDVTKSLPIELLPGVAARLDKMVGSLKNTFASPANEIAPKYRTFSVSEKLKCQVELKRPEQKYIVGLKRIGRVRTPYAEAAMGALANYHTRMAFDFDFSKIPEKS